MLRFFGRAWPVCVALTLTPAALMAQGEPFHRRISVGMRAGWIALEPIPARTGTNETTALKTTQTNKTGSWRGTVGAAMEFRLSERISLGLDFLYKKPGYDREYKVETVVPSGSTATQIFLESERTQGKTWEFPLTGRYSWWLQEGKRPRLYFMAGPALRTVLSANGVRRTTAQNGDLAETTGSVRPANKNTFGGVAGAGVEWKDDVGIRVSFEGRYTRWLKPSFNIGPARSNRDQVEVLIGFTF